MKAPNILFIMSDDHSANAISAYGSHLASVFQTPNMDRLAKEGLRLDNFFSTNAICTPARASIVSGQYGHITGVKTLADTFPQNYGTNMIKELKDKNYQTAIIGKWHLYCKPQHFDYFDILPGQGLYNDPVFINSEAAFWKQDNYDIHRVSDSVEKKEQGLIKHKGYVTEIITKKSIEWLQKRDKDTPFFLMCHHKAPHDFWEFVAKYENLFDGVDIPVPDSLFEDKSHRSEATRDYGSSVSPRSSVHSLYRDFCKEDYVTGPLENTEQLSFREKALAAYQKYLKDYLRTVASIDESVGDLLDELERQQVLDDTLIVYTSDQGMFLGEHDYQDKRWSYEESLRCPFLVRYPKTIAAGSISEELMANIDVAPTLLEYAGCNVPEGMQGVSLREMFDDGECGESAASARDSVYFRYWMHRTHHDNPAHYGIRTVKWKLIFFYGLPLDASGAKPAKSQAGWELYDMENDPYELQNLYGKSEYAEIIAALKEQLRILKEQYKDTDEDYPELLARYAETQ